MRAAQPVQRPLLIAIPTTPASARIVSTEYALQFRERIAVFDSELVPGSIVYPI